jgi:hypothetical protein
MTITFYRKDVYGNTLYYIASAEHATAFHKLTGKKTLTSRDMNAFGAFGITFTEVINPN